MTSESDFYAMLDANPDDHWTRLILADFLQEKDDPRAEGFRAIAHHPLEPTDHRGQKEDVGLAYWKYHPTPKLVRWSTWNEWWDLVEDGRPFPELGMGKFFRKVSHAESAFALAFAKLPEARRRELRVTAPQPEGSR